MNTTQVAEVAHKIDSNAKIGEITGQAWTALELPEVVPSKVLLGVNVGFIIYMDLDAEDYHYVSKQVEHSSKPLNSYLRDMISHCESLGTISPPDGPGKYIAIGHRFAAAPSVPPSFFLREISWTKAGKVELRNNATLPDSLMAHLKSKGYL